MSRVRLCTPLVYVFPIFSHIHEISLSRVSCANEWTSRKLLFPFLFGPSFTAANGTVKPVGLCAQQTQYLHLKHALWISSTTKQRIGYLTASAILKKARASGTRASLAEAFLSLFASTWQLRLGTTFANEYRHVR